MAKSQRTGIRLRGNTFGDSQSSKMKPTPHLTILRKLENLPPEKEKKTYHLIYLITNLTYGVRTSQELPNQLVLQTGHRNAQAKHAP